MCQNYSSVQRSSVRRYGSTLIRIKLSKCELPVALLIPKIWFWSQNLWMGHMTLTTPLSGVVWHPYVTNFKSLCLSVTNICERGHSIIRPTSRCRREGGCPLGVTVYDRGGRFFRGGRGFVCAYGRTYEALAGLLGCLPPDEGSHNENYISVITGTEHHTEMWSEH